MPISAPAAVLAALIAFAPAMARAQPTPGAPVAHATQATHAGSGAAKALMPGFETLADGSTRLSLELSKTVSYTTQTAPGKITYVLKDVHIGRRNNRNPLVTVHFNTPLRSARLEQHGRDVWFVLDLRASVQPQVTIDATKDNAALMRIDLPKGQYITPAAPSTATAPSESAAESASPKP